jgi:hypothetical protein
MAIANIAAIRALATKPVQRKTLTIEGWGDVEIQRLTVGQVFESQVLAQRAGGLITQEVGIYTITRAVIAPAFTEEDIIALWDHPNLSPGLQALLNEIAAFNNTSPTQQQEVVKQAAAAFPAGVGGPDAPGRSRSVPVRAGAEAGQDAGGTG